VVPLNVSGAFHSPLMAPAAARLTDAIQHTPLHALRVPVVCNVDATVVDEADQLPDRLSRQLEAPVRWMECVARLVDLGADTLVEVGPGAVLSGLARRIAPGTATVNVADRAGAVALAELRTAPA
jgi:[acyl-carrier-protein] S-malonyltransferase